VELHTDAVHAGDKVVIIDDLLATGGTLEAAVKLVEQLGGQVVKILTLIALQDLGGRERLRNYDVESIVTYTGK
jgi:adenine phosphoribosyltransferase